MTIETKFEYAQKVYLPQLKVTGRVKAFYLTQLGGVQYSIRYFTEAGKPEQEYFFEDEITAEIPAEKRTGFGKEER